jgi:hypothetical protein
MTDQSNILRAVPVGEESKLTNADEAVRPNMLHVASQELRYRECHKALSAFRAHSLASKK